MRTRSASALLVLLAVAAAAVAVAEGIMAGGNRTRTLLLRKCCPLGEQLSSQLDGCEPLDGAAAEEGARGYEEEADVLLRRFPGGFPPWMSNETALYDGASEQPLNQSLLEGQPPGAYVRYGPLPPCERAEAKYFVWTRKSRYRLLANGTLLLRTDAQEEPQLAVPAEDFCADRVSTARPTFIFLVCPCRRTVCVSKCCNRVQHHAIQASRTHVSYTCDDSGNLAKWTPRFTDSVDGGPPLEDVDYVILDTNQPTCGPKTVPVLLNTQSEDRPRTVRVLPNGSALLEGYGYGPGQAFPPGSWCGDWAVLHDGVRVESALFCAPLVTPSSSPTGRPLLYGALFAVSSFFLLLTLLVYALLPQLRRTAQGKALMSHVAALFCGSLALASGQLRSVIGRAECVFMGFIIQYTMLATFFWLNVLCFDIACSLKWGERRTSALGLHAFWWYSFYGWGGPIIIVLVTIALQFSEDLPNSVVLPDIGVSSCWFHTPAAGWAFFYGPLAVLLFLNAALFVVASVKLLHAERNKRSLLRSAGIAAALFVLTGVSWLCEVASFADGSDKVVWTVMDVVNILRGLFVFVLLCCRPKVGQLLRRRLCVGREEGGLQDGSSEGRTSVYSALQMDVVSNPRDAPDGSPGAANGDLPHRP